nr:alpha-amylase family glycosyl hydrolase [Salinimonas marina]
MPATAPITQAPSQTQQKPVVYQVFTRLFGNTNSNNVPWGSIEQNGVGKFADFSDTALSEIRQLGVSHIWFTGVPHHVTTTDYTAYGISLDDPDVIKGRAGSPYAVKDYYNVDPDLAQDPARRMAEFEALIKRTHAHGMKVIIDIVPNHVARHYESVNTPAGVPALGSNDDPAQQYQRDNHFYYVPGTSFAVPEHPGNFHPLGGAAHPLADGQFDETPAKWTGNGARSAQPSASDWYETVKLNYGVKPDGSFDFPALPVHFANKPYAKHYAFWQNQDLPDAWYRMREIALFWLDKGVDGFRFDMAEMVPVEFWSFLNASIKHHKPDAFLLAEVYQPERYRDYLHRGLMDYLYDKVGFYDTLKRVMQQQDSVTSLDDVAARVSDIESSMLHFLENHDEQRIASEPFAGDAQRGKPALAVSALKSDAPYMLYFGQEVGEDGSEDMGFGDPSRTSIFDYAGVPAHQRWMNDGKFDGGQLTDDEQALRRFYTNVLNLAAYHPAMQGKMHSLLANQAVKSGEGDQVYSFVRSDPHQALLVLSNFSDSEQQVNLNIPISHTGLAAGTAVTAYSLLSGTTIPLMQQHNRIQVQVNVAATDAQIIELTVAANHSE